MSNRNDDIDKLFSKKFEKYEVKTSEEEWLELSPKLSRSNFLRFSYITFNIYYLSVIMVLAATVGFAGVKNYQLTQKLISLEQNVKTSSPKEKTISTPTSPVETKKEEESKATVDQSSIIMTTKPVQPVNSVISIKAKEKEQPNVKEERKDTAQLSSQNLTVSDSLSQIKIKKIKRTLVVKPRTVIVKKDTVIITKHHK